MITLIKDEKLPMGVSYEQMEKGRKNYSNISFQHKVWTWFHLRRRMSEIQQTFSLNTFLRSIVRLVLRGKGFFSSPTIVVWMQSNMKL